MTQEQKELLFKDLCSRLPYGVKCRYQHIQYIENSKIIDINMFGRVNVDGHVKDICDVKPYLFPLSSMSEEQKEEYDLICSMSMFDMSESDAVKLIDWLNKNHFDYRGLIPMELAIDATGLNIY